MLAYGKDNFSTMATVPSHACPLSIDGKSLRFKFILVSLLHLNAVTKASFLLFLSLPIFSLPPVTGQPACQSPPLNVTQ